MIFPRSHVWTPLQKGLVVAGVLMTVCSLGVAIYSYERYYRGLSDSILVGDWEIPGTDTPLCYHFDPDHSFYVAGCGENEPVVRGRWYAGGRNLYLKWAPDDADYLGFKRPQIFYITDVEPSALSLATSLPKTTYVAHGKTYCAIHRVPLVPRRMFTSRVMLIHYGEERCAECGERFPNEIGPGYVRHRTSFYPDATTVAYCPMCEEAFRRCVAGSPCESDLTNR